ncbi:hypothetical protein CHUAL_003175 [Chamberlinius hualienensis]
MESNGYNYELLCGEYNRGGNRGRYRGRAYRSNWRPHDRGNFHRPNFRNQRHDFPLNNEGNYVPNGRQDQANETSHRSGERHYRPIHVSDDRRGSRRAPFRPIRGRQDFRHQVNDSSAASGYSGSNSRSSTDNHRPYSSTNSNSSASNHQSFHGNEGTQRECLSEGLRRGSCDCIICFDRIRQNDRIWSCSNCYQIFHLNCIKKWVNSSAEKQEVGWRCPGCQNVFDEIPRKYFCFCGKEENPEWNRNDTWRLPHSCGQQCLRKRRLLDCNHPCTLLCHPGPCPPCGSYVIRRCFCGETTKQTRCDDESAVSCEIICDKALSCGLHKCERNCHLNDEHVCYEIIIQTCFCEKSSREVQCNKGVDRNYSCGEICGKIRKCGHHTCDLLCHSGECPPCDLSPELLTHCPCGKSPLSNLAAFTTRTLCTDPVPVCNNICGKLLTCGGKDEEHKCTSRCHSGPCPSCSLMSSLKCNCGGSLIQVNCSEVTTDSIVKCKKRCNKPKTCRRHRCNQNCCTDTQHKCDLICGQKLSCNLDRCDRPCHLGNCPPCQNTSFDELACHCGTAVLFPPIPCGTRPPECDEPCQRQHNCEHPPQHKCHSESVCPPCTVLTAKWCYGEHELRSCIPCFQTDVCCGLPCGRFLSCGRHNCSRRCHSGFCQTEGEICTQPCTNPRSECGHPCLLPCHEGDCATSSCKSIVTVTCRCGRRSASVYCAENLSIYNRMAALQMANVVNIDEKLQRTRTLECDGECALEDRNRRLALALQIRNPDITNKLRPPAYSDFLKDQAKKSPELVSSIYQQFTELVHNAKESKQKSRSFAFQPMKSDHRRVIHELSEFFGCETQSYDQEPKKNVVATAFKDKSWLPSASLLSVIEKESTGNLSRLAGKAPPPVPHCSSRRDPQTNTVERQDKPTSVVDYFDYTD